MNRTNARRTYRYRTRNKRRQLETPNTFGIKVVLSLFILLSVLLVKKYDLSIGNVNIDSIYEVLYYDENLGELSNRVFKNDSALSDIFNLNTSEPEN